MIRQLFDRLAMLLTNAHANHYLDHSLPPVYEDTAYPTIGDISSPMGGYVDDTCSDADLAFDSDPHLVNPATALPMVDGMGGVDCAGNPYGMDLSSPGGEPGIGTAGDPFAGSFFDSFGCDNGSFSDQFSGGYDSFSNDWNGSSGSDW